MKTAVWIDDFDTELREPAPTGRMTQNQRDIEILRRAKRVSIFWITETMRRATLITRLQKAGELELDNTCGFPWLIVRRCV